MDGSGKKTQSFGSTKGRRPARSHSTSSKFQKQMLKRKEARQKEECRENEETKGAATATRDIFPPKKKRIQESIKKTQQDIEVQTQKSKDAKKQEQEDLNRILSKKKAFTKKTCRKKKTEAGKGKKGPRHSRGTGRGAKSQKAQPKISF